MFQPIFIYASLQRGFLSILLVLLPLLLIYDPIEAVTEVEPQNFTFLAYLPQQQQLPTKLESLQQIGLEENAVASKKKRLSVMVSAITRSWSGALSSCYQMNGVLVSINNAELDAAIRSALVSQGIVGPIWTSGRYQYTGEPRHLNLFLWAGNGQDFLYTNWNTGQPATSWAFNTCVAVQQQGFFENQYKWRTGSCASQYKFICVI